jgi:hypothetical protein
VCTRNTVCCSPTICLCGRRKPGSPACCPAMHWGLCNGIEHRSSRLPTRHSGACFVRPASSAPAPCRLILARALLRARLPWDAGFIATPDTWPGLLWRASQVAGRHPTTAGRGWRARLPPSRPQICKSGRGTEQGGVQSTLLATAMETSGASRAFQGLSQKMPMRAAHTAQGEQATRRRVRRASPSATDCATLARHSTLALALARGASQLVAPGGSLPERVAPQPLLPSSSHPHKLRRRGVALAGRAVTSGRRG